MDAAVQTPDRETAASSTGWVRARTGRVSERLSGPLARARPLLRPLALFAASRVLVFFASAVGAFLATQSGRPILTGPWPVIAGSRSGALEGLLRWDSAWYVTLASHGYPSTAAEGHIAFFPLFPGVVRVVMTVTGLRAGPAGLLVATTAGAVATVLVWVLGRRLAGSEEADRMAALFAFFPGSFVLSMVYSESLLLVLVLACLLALDSRHWVTAGAFAALATATRPNGLAVAVACAWAAFMAIRQERDWRALAAPALAPLGILGFFFYLYEHTGDRLAWFTSQRVIWHERIDPIAQLHRVSLFLKSPLSPIGSLNTSLPVLGGVLIVLGLLALWRWRPTGTVVAYALAACAIVLTSATIGARPRMVLAAVPLVMAIAHGVRGAWFAALLGLSAGCLALLMVLTVGTTAVTP